MTKTQIVLFVSLFVLLSQTLLILEFLPILDVLFSGLRVLLFFVMMGFLYFKHFYITQIEKYLLLYAVFVGTVSFMFSSQISIFVFQLMNIMILLTIFKFFEFNDILRYSVIILSVFVYVNFVLTLLYPSAHFYVDGRPAFILGKNYNSMGPTLLTAVVSNAMYSYIANKFKINLILITIVSVLTVLIMGSMTSSVGIILFGLFILFVFFVNKYISRLALKLFFIFVMLMNVGLLYLQMEIDNNYLVWFIEDVLGKDITFTDRVRVWEEAIYLIEESKWIGYGIQPSSWFDYHLNVLTAHNFILTMLLKGGIVLFSIFLVVVYVAVRKANKNATNAVTVLQFGASVFLLMMTMETYSMILIFYYIFLNYFSSEIDYDT